MSNNQEPNLGYTEALGEYGSNPTTPRTNGDTLLALGREWTVSSLEMRIQAQFEKWCRTNAKKAITEADMEDGPEEAGAMRSAYAAALGAGHYNWDGRYCRSARGDLPGIRYLLYLLIKRCHPEVTEDQIETMFQENPRGCGMAIRWALGNMGEVESQTQSQPKTTTDTRGKEGNVRTPTTVGVRGLTEEEKELVAYARKKKQEESGIGTSPLRQRTGSGQKEVDNDNETTLPQKNLVGKDKIEKRL
jgi:hypothetical protein